MSVRRKRCAGCRAPLVGMRADAVWCSRKCYIAHRRDPRPYKGPTSGPSGLQVSYRRMVQTLADELASQGYEWPTVKATAIVRGALSDAQRARLDARDA